jgi:hypothetical protein
MSATPAGVANLLYGTHMRGHIGYEGEQVKGDHPALVRGVK